MSSFTPEEPKYMLGREHHRVSMRDPCRNSCKTATRRRTRTFHPVDVSTYGAYSISWSFYKFKGTNNSFF
jgi:hypothetical protein